MKLMGQVGEGMKEKCLKCGQDLDYGAGEMTVSICCKHCKIRHFVLHSSDMRNNW